MSFLLTMDPVNVIRAPSLKRGKADERLSDRVSILSVFDVWDKTNSLLATSHKVRFSAFFYCKHFIVRTIYDFCCCQ